MKVEKVEPIPIMKIYNVETFKCTVPSTATPDDSNSFDIEDETEVDAGSPVEIKEMTAVQIVDALTTAGISK